MKRLNRFFSIVLVCVMVLSSVSTSWVAKAETTYSMKEDFEDDTTGSVNYGSTAFSLYDSTVSENDKTNVHGGSKSLQMVAANDIVVIRRQLLRKM